MQLRRFRAATISEAYARVREELGDDAVIVSTHSAPGVPGAGRSSGVEVVAGAPDGGDAATAPITFDQDAAAHDLVRGVAEAQAAGQPLGIEAADGGEPSDEPPLAPPFVNEMAGAIRHGPFDLWGGDGDGPPAQPPPSDATSQPADSPVEPATAPRSEQLLAVMARQLAELRGIVERISNERVNERVDAGPQGLQEARARLIEQGVSPAALMPALDQVANAMVPDATRKQAWQALQRRLAAQLAPVTTLELGQPPLAVFVLGPGGSGKTSFAVRLGRELAETRGARVALAGFDINRAGAPQQLTACGAATGLAVRLCYTPGELKTLLDSGSADVVVVDSPGHNGSRSDRTAELHAFLRAAPHRVSLLALPATAKTADLLRMTAALTPAGLDGVVLTRCDETNTFGALYSVAVESGLGVAYSTHGEGISVGLRPADNHALATAVLRGRWPRPTGARPAMARAG